MNISKALGHTFLILAKKDFTCDKTFKKCKQIAWQGLKTLHFHFNGIFYKLLQILMESVKIFGQNVLLSQKKKQVKYILMEIKPSKIPSKIIPSLKANQNFLQKVF